MHVTIIGTGYVGLVTGVCLADAGNVVVGYDVDAAKVARLREGSVPIFESGLADLLCSNLAAGRLRFTTDVTDAVRSGEVLFIAVGTPALADGSPDLSAIERVVRDISPHIDKHKIVVMKSTVPVGSSERLAALFAQCGCGDRVTLVSNPEFLREGSAVSDFQHPDRVVIGTDDAHAATVMRDLHRPFVSADTPVQIVPRAAAEVIKYAANAYLAMRISFINQIATLCERSGVEIDDVVKGIGADARIGSGFLSPGMGYGGSCFPKDVKGLVRIARQRGAGDDLFAATDAVNVRQQRRLLDFMDAHFGPSIRGKTIAIWGCSFKPKTDDIREAPALVTIAGLLERGAMVRAHDPKALPHIERLFGAQVTCCRDAYEALAGSDALAICTEWAEFRAADLSRVKQLLGQPIVFDGRNVYNTDLMRRLGFVYYSIGRPPVR